MKSLVDKLAAIEHRQWEQWAKTIIETEPGLSKERVERWKKLFIPFSELSDEWQEYDREWARHALREVLLHLDDED